MRCRCRQLFILVLTLGTLWGCRKTPESEAPAPAPDAVVARFKGGEIRRSEISAAVENRLAAVPRPVDSETRRSAVRKVLERRVRVAALTAEAKASGFAESPKAQFRSLAAEEKLLAADLVASRITGVQAADALVAAAVESRLQSLRPEEARKFSHIFLRAPQEDAAARTKASATMAEILAAIESGTGFNTLAERYSDSVMARGGGRIEWTLRKDLQPAAAETIFALREGAVSPVVETRDGLHLFRLDGIRSGSPIDVEQVRRSVRRELDEEAAALAERALRQRELDAAGVEFASAQTLARLSAAGSGSDSWVARWEGGEVRAAELAAGISSATGARVEPGVVLRELVENRLLALRRRETPLSPELESRVKRVRDEAMLSAYRASLIAGIASEPTAEELERYYRDNAQGALFLRDYHLDLLFFPQAGEDVAEAYGAAEEVVAKLREGAAFEALLEAPGRPGAFVCRDAHPVDVEALGKTFLRLRRAMLNLEVGGVSPALYFDGPRSAVVPGKCELQGRGVAFARLREVGTLPFDAAREALRAQVMAEKEKAGIEAIQERLVAESGLEILLPEG